LTKQEEIESHWEEMKDAMGIMGVVEKRRRPTLPTTTCIYLSYIL